MNENTKVLFVALLPSRDLAEEISARRTQFERIDDLRFTRTNNLHITVFYIGAVPTNSLALISKALREMMARTKPFSLVLSDVVAAPPHKPSSTSHMLWISFQKSAVFEDLAYTIREVIKEAAGISHSKYLHPLPHITLARFKKETILPEDLPQLQDMQGRGLRAKEIVLMESVRNADGTDYHILDRFPFGVQLDTTP